MQKKCWMLSVSVLISLTRSGRIWRRLEKWLRKKSSNFRTVSAQYVHVFNIGNQIHSVHESIEQYLKYLCNNKPNGTFYFNFSSSLMFETVYLYSWNQIYNLFLNVIEFFWLNIGTGWLVQERARTAAEDWWSIREQPESPETREGQNEQRALTSDDYSNSIQSILVYKLIYMCTSSFFPSKNVM